MKNLIVLSMFAAVLAASVCVADYSSPGGMNGRTVDLWQMDAITMNSSSSRVNGVSADNNLWFMLRNSAGVDAPNLGELVPGVFGSAVSFAANASCAETDKPNLWARTRTSLAWQNWPYVKVEGWVKFYDLVGLQFVVSTQTSWRISSSGSYLQFTLWFSDGSNSASQSISIAGRENEWLYFTGSFDESETLEFSVKNVDGSFNQSLSLPFPGKTLTTTNGLIILASDGGARRSLNGAIDSLRISRPDVVLDIDSPREDTPKGTYGLWHFDEQADSITPDDNSMDLFGRNYPLTMTQGASLVTPAVYPAGNADFGTCLELDGMGGYVSHATFPTVDTSLFNIEFWMQMNPGILPGTVGQVTGALWLIDGGTLRVYLEVGGTGVSLRYMINNIAYQLNSAISLDGGWNHYRLTFDNGTMKIYENDGIIGTLVTGLTEMMAPTGTLRIGSYGGTQRYFWGWLDEVRLYGNTTAVCGDFGYLPADINKDCYVNDLDIKMLADNWLDCTFEGDANCDSLN